MYIEEMYRKTGILEAKRSNMNINSKKCNDTLAGVDLNRNYGYGFGQGDSKN